MTYVQNAVGGLCHLQRSSCLSTFRTPCLSGHSPQKVNYSVSENTLGQNPIGQEIGAKPSGTAFLLNEKLAAHSIDGLPLVALTNRPQVEAEIPVTAGLSECPGGPIAQDDFAITALNTSVTINVLSNDATSNRDAFEVVLLNTPVGATAIVNNDGMVVFTPDVGFLGTSTIHFLVEDSKGNSSEATITVEVLTQFAFNTFNDLSPGETIECDDVCQPSCCRHDSLTEKIFTLVAQPIFRGSACPGAVVTGRIYDQSGALVGEASVNSDQKGRWMLQIDDVRDQEFYRVEFYHVPNGCSSSDVAFSLDPAVDSYQLMKPLTLHKLS